MVKRYLHSSAIDQDWALLIRTIMIINIKKTYGLLEMGFQWKLGFERVLEQYNPYSTGNTSPAKIIISIYFQCPNTPCVLLYPVRLYPPVPCPPVPSCTLSSCTLLCLPALLYCPVSPCTLLYCPVSPWTLLCPPVLLYPSCVPLFSCTLLYPSVILYPPVSPCYSVPLFSWVLFCTLLYPVIMYPPVPVLYPVLYPPVPPCSPVPPCTLFTCTLLPSYSPVPSCTLFCTLMPPYSPVPSCALLWTLLCFSSSPLKPLDLLGEALLLAAQEADLILQLLSHLSLLYTQRITYTLYWPQSVTLLLNDVTYIMI